MSLSLEEALGVLGRHRGDKVVMPTMASVGVWPTISDSPLDFAYMPSSMGQGPALGLGIALAQQRHGVIVICGDGSLLMNLGNLITIASYPAALYLILIDNGLYEVTGGQAYVGANRIDYAALAKAAGISRTYLADQVSEWERLAADALNGPGPVFVWLKVAGKLGEKTPRPARPMAEQIQRLQAALAQ